MVTLDPGTPVRFRAPGARRWQKGTVKRVRGNVVEVWDRAMRTRTVKREDVRKA